MLRPCAQSGGRSSSSPQPWPPRWSRSTGAQVHPDFLLGTDLAESHGCVRVSRAMSQWIWGFATAGTTVVVLP